MTTEHRILLVDDDLADRLLARQIIRRTARELDLPITLQEACSGSEALALIPSFSPTLLLVDLRMPAMDGFELIRRLRGVPEAAGAELVVLSTSSAPRDRSEAQRLGCDDYIVKPLRADDLTARLDPPPPEPAPAPAPLADGMAPYQVLMEELSDIAVLVFDAQLRYHFAGGAALARHGWSASAMLGSTLDEVFPPAVADGVRPLYRAALSGQRATYAYTGQEGNRYEILTRPVPAEDGAPWGMLLIREVTALHRAQETVDAQRAQLARLQACVEELQQEAGHWARFASHDLSAVLRQVGSAEVVEEDERAAFFSAILPSAREARARLDQLLAYHEASQPLLVWRQLDVPAMFSALRAARAARIRARGATVGCDPMPRLSFDADAMRQILTSLLDNALSRSPAARPMQIWLSGRAVTGGMELSLSDTGADLSGSERVDLFRPRWQLDGRDGVGLATARRLLDAVGGWIRVSHTPGGGLTVSLLVPHPPAKV